MSLMQCEYFLDFLKENIMNGDIPEMYVDEEILKSAQTHAVHDYKTYNVNGETFIEKTDFDELKEFSIVYDNEDEEFPIDLIVKGDKVLINSVILLNQKQWNAITDDNKCHVCNVAVQDIYGHISTAGHKLNLDNYKPLKIFDQHIIRKIGVNYHCAVCNALYNARDHNKHIDSVMHLEKMLYATNRVVDVTNDIDAADVTSDSVSCDTSTVCETESGFDSDNTDLLDTNLVNDNVPSYASVLKRSKNKPRQYIDFICENNKWKIPFDTYHTLLKINKQYYCTICVQFFNVCAKVDHCTSSEHLRKLEMCEAYDNNGHFIRKVTPTFNHCGTCNNLVMSYQLEQHLRKHSKIKKSTKNMVECNTKTNVANETKNNEIKHTNESVEMKQNTINRDINNSTPESLNIQQSNKINTSSMQYIVLNHFFCNFRLHFMSYHTVIRRGFDFVCVLCNIFITDVNDHIHDPRHVICLRNVIFHPQFGVNLIRMVREGGHCAICNVVVAGIAIHAHIVTQSHVNLLNNSIIHRFPPNNFANMPIPVHNMPVMAFPFAINRMPFNMPPYHHTINNVNVNLYRIVPTDNAYTTVKRDESKIEELNPLKVDDLTNKETQPTVSISMRNRNDTIDTSPMSTENILDINTDETKTDDDDDDDDDTNTSNNNTIDDKEYELKLLNDILYIRNRNDVIAMSEMTYNSLIHAGDGKIYCFVCQTKIISCIIKHVESKQHVDRIKESKFIAEYEYDLLRQVNNNFHCSICNVLFPKTVISKHMKWPTHIERKKWVVFDNNIHKNTIESAFRDEDKDVNMEDGVKILLNIKSGAKNSKNIGGYVVIMYDEKKVMNISFDAFNGLTTIKNMPYCNLCCDYFVDKDLHLEEKSHIDALEAQLEVKYFPSCYRKVVGGMLNCVTCNTNLPNQPKHVKQHGTGKRHRESYSCVMEDAYTIV